MSSDDGSISEHRDRELARVTQRLERLQRIAGELNRATTVAEVIDTVMNVLDGPAHAPSRGLWLHVPGSDVLEAVASAGLPASTAARFARLPIGADLPGAIAYREKRTVARSSRAAAEEDFDALQGVERSTEGFAAVPLLLDDVCLGVLALGYDVELDEADIAFLEAIARQVAQTLARVRLAERDQRRRIELEFLADLTDAALGAVDHLELMRDVTAAAVPMLGDWCTLYFLPEESTTPQIAVAHVDPAKADRVRRLQERYPYDPDNPTGVAAVIRSGEAEFVPHVTSEVIDDVLARPGRDTDELREAIDAFQLTSVITVPLLTKRRIVGAMQFVTAESGRRYDDDDVALAEAVAGRLAEALDSAWLADQQRQIAVTLQRALLPPRLPSVPGVEIAARYWPAGGAEVGGDFYDVFAVDDSSWCIVIGDACGTGPNAAALTSIARHTVRAAVRHGVADAEVVDWLNEAVLLSDRDLFCTACVTMLTRGDGTWQMTSVAAGHPLPILLSQDQGTSVVGRPGTLLGAFPSVTTSPARVCLQAGDVVVFYTDGITDLPPPHGLTPEGMVALVESLRDCGSAADIADGIHESVMQRVPERSQRDDIAVVILRMVDA